MKAHEFFLLINEIDDALVQEAEGESAALKKRFPSVEFVAAAACFAAIVIGIFLIAKIRINNTITPGDSAVAESVSSSSSSSDTLSSSFTTSSASKINSSTQPAEPPMFFKEPKPEDIVYDVEHNVSYVKNQLLISAVLDAPQEETERIIKELGAEIVGYIEITNDYQIEFTADKTLAELEAAADYLDSFPFVQGVTLNLVHEINYDVED